MKFITHPNNLLKIKQQIEKEYGKPDDDYLGIHKLRTAPLFGIDIICDADINEKELVPTGKFKRNPDHVLCDNRYFDWVTEDDIVNGTRWMRDIGLIVDVLEERPVYYAIRDGFAYDGNKVCKL